MPLKPSKDVVLKKGRLIEEENVDYQIRELYGRWVLDSRGYPTVACVASTKTATATALVPTGTSTGSYEAVDLRDGGKAFEGKHVLKAISNVNNKIFPVLKGMDCRKQEEIDKKIISLDKTTNKSNIGGNATLAASTACLKLCAKTQGLALYELLSQNKNVKKIKNKQTKPRSKAYQLPIPFANIINGGKHAPVGAPSFQEYMLVPLKFRVFSDAVTAVAETYHELKKIIASKYGPQYSAVGDEGGFIPPCKSVEEPLHLLSLATRRAGYEKEMCFAIDAAAGSFFKNAKYVLNKKRFSAEKLTDVYALLAKDFPLISIEDPFEENDFYSFAELTRSLGSSVQIVGDDLLATNPKRIAVAASKRACNCALIKPNQIGTITETLRAIEVARAGGFSTMFSHRSGDTEDSFVADFAVGVCCPQIKVGAPCRGERTAKYNRLFEIKCEQGSNASYAGGLCD